MMSKALAFRRKSPRADDLDKARAGLAAATARLAELRTQREGLLLSTADDGATAAIDVAIEDQRRAEQAQADRIRLIEEEIRQEEEARGEQRRAEQVERQVAKLAEADEAAAELATVLERTVVPLFDRVIRLREEVAAGMAAGDAAAALLNVAEIRNLLSVEFYRLSARPLVGAARGLPGARCPDLDFINQPEAIKPFATALSEASAYAAQAMRKSR